MSVVETIQQKVLRLPLPAQQEVLAMVEQLEASYQPTAIEHPLTRIAKMAKDLGVTDLAARHDFYANRKLEG